MRARVDPDPGRLLAWASLGAALLAALLAAMVGVLLSQGMQLSALEGLGYPGVTLVMFFSSSTVFLPAPGWAAVMAAGVAWNPLLVGLFAGLGSSLGELTGYLVGVSGRNALAPQEGRRWRRLERWMERYGFATILVLASIPNPVFDIVGVVAGSLRYSPRRLWVACIIGNTVKYTLLAFVGDTVLTWLGLMR